MRRRSVILFLAVLSLPALAGPEQTTIGVGTLRGAPTFEGGEALGYFIWVDAEGLHLRWTTDEEPKLFTGRIDLDKPVKEIKRVRQNVGGWARMHGKRIVLFSSTVRSKDIDGIDLVVPQGRTAQLAIDIDSKPPGIEQIFLGEKEKNPKGVPLRLLLR